MTDKPTPGSAASDDDDFEPHVEVAGKDFTWPVAEPTSAAPDVTPEGQSPSFAAANVTPLVIRCVHKGSGFCDPCRTTLMGTI